MYCLLDGFSEFSVLDVLMYHLHCLNVPLLLTSFGRLFYGAVYTQSSVYIKNTFLDTVKKLEGNEE